MIGSQQPRPTTRRSARSIRRRRWIAWSASLLVLGTAAVTGIALANGTATVDTSHITKLNKTVAADSRGHTLYALSPETAHHLLCKSRECLENWPPLTVRSKRVKLVAGQDVAGRLGLLRRHNGTLQVTLRGLPLYRFGGDSKTGEANGDGIRSFGGTWHAVPANPAETVPSMTPAPSTTPTVSPPSPGYGY
jgi:predicted lipoprotein with Yx(FWY)xxD motif